MESEIKNLLNSLNIDYEDKGNYFKFHCINPDHVDKNPSMTMLKNNGYCRCWSCGDSYSLYEFVKMFGEDYNTYFKKENVLSRKFKNELIITEKNYFTKPKREFKILDGRLLEIIKNTKTYDYLKSINVNDEMIEYFNIKYSEYAVITFASNGKATRIYNRILVPILENGEIVNMECRDYTKNQSHKVIYPSGSKADVVWNFDQIDHSKPIYVVEGIKSAFRIWRYVTPNVVATLGSGIGKNQKKVLQNCKNIILFPDNDEAGKSMINQFESFMNHSFKIIFMPKEGQDPADGTEKDLEKALQNEKSNVHYFLSKYDFYKNKNRKISWEGVKI